AKQAGQLSRWRASCSHSSAANSASASLYNRGSPEQAFVMICPESDQAIVATHEGNCNKSSPAPHPVLPAVLLGNQLANPLVWPRRHRFIRAPGPAYELTQLRARGGKVPHESIVRSLAPVFRLPDRRPQVAAKLGQVKIVQQRAMMQE